MCCSAASVSLATPMSRMPLAYLPCYATSFSICSQETLEAMQEAENIASGKIAIKHTIPLKNCSGIWNKTDADTIALSKMTTTTQLIEDSIMRMWCCFCLHRQICNHTKKTEKKSRIPFGTRLMDSHRNQSEHTGKR